MKTCCYTVEDKTSNDKMSEEITQSKYFVSMLIFPLIFHIVLIYCNYKVYYYISEYLFIFFSQGDSGGPLMSKINQKYHIIGIASSETNTDCTLNKPMIFTDVVKFLNWIQREKKTTLSLPRGA